MCIHIQDFVVPHPFDLRSPGLNAPAVPKWSNGRRGFAAGVVAGEYGMW